MVPIFILAFHDASIEEKEYPNIYKMVAYDLI